VPNRIERASALPIDLFGDQAIFEMEIADIWHRDWVFATTVDAVAERGDFVSVTVGRQSVIVVRGQDYRIRAFANVCSHRGAPLVECDGNTSRFSCPYHAWTYDTEGQLVSVPYAQPDEVVKAEHELTEFRAEQWHGFVFVSLNEDVESMAERASAIEPYIKPLAFDRFHHDVAATGVEKWNANWKLTFANALDSYSHFRVHAETIEPVSPTDGSYYLAGSARATVTGGESHQRADHLVISLPPSFVAVVYPDALLWQSFQPVDVAHTAVTIGMAGEGPPSESVAVNLPGWEPDFIDEDRAMCERLQTNVGSRWTPGPLLDIERSLADFHEYLSWRLSDHDPQDPFFAARPGHRPEPGG